jgi:hypothetical protein
MSNPTSGRATTPSNTYVTPTVHLNGTSRAMLNEGYTKAYEAVRGAVEALASVEFNARDYYVQPTGAWTTARAQREKQFVDLRSVQTYLETILESLQP